MYISTYKNVYTNRNVIKMLCSITNTSDKRVFYLIPYPIKCYVCYEVYYCSRMFGDVANWYRNASVSAPICYILRISNSVSAIRDISYNINVLNMNHSSL